MSEAIVTSRTSLGQLPDYGQTGCCSRPEVRLWEVHCFTGSVTTNALAVLFNCWREADLSFPIRKGRNAPAWQACLRFPRIPNAQTFETRRTGTIGVASTVGRIV